MPLWGLSPSSETRASATTTMPLITTISSTARKHTPHKRTTCDYSLPSFMNDSLTLPLAEALEVHLTSPPSQVTARLHELRLNSKASPSPAAAPTPQHPFLKAMNTVADTRTNKGGFAYKTTNSALLDLYDELKPGVEAQRLFTLLEGAWKVDPIVTMKIVFHARSIHEGKGFAEGFFRASAWMYGKHPHTFLANLHLLTDPTCIRYRSADRDQARDRAQALKGVAALDEDDNLIIEPGEDPEYPRRPHGSFKDLVDILILYINGQFTTAHLGHFTALNQSLAPSNQARAFKAQRLNPSATRNNNSKTRKEYVTLAKLSGVPVRRARQPPTVGPNTLTFQAQMAKLGTQRDRHELLRSRLMSKLTSDSKFSALYITVVDIFVRQLRKDQEQLKQHEDFVKLPEAQRGDFKGQTSPHLFGMSYAAKWVPTPAHGADRQLHLATGIMVRLFAILQTDRVAVNTGRERLQREILTPLRRAPKVPETKMGKGKWNIDYTKVPSRAMARNEENFLKHDPAGFERYIDQVAAGTKTVSGAALDPHEILVKAVHGQPLSKCLANHQWKALVRSIASSSQNQMSNCLAVADVSGSMGSFSYLTPGQVQPIHVCISLTLLLGELCAPPWNGSFFTFSSNPTWETIDTSLPLSERVGTLSRAHWEMSTNFYKVFDLILNTAQRNRLTNDQMIKKLFVFSDMQFDQASKGSYGVTEYHNIKDKFTRAGYDMPEMVFWNLDSRGGPPNNKPVRADERGVAMMSGFAAGQLKYFLRGVDAAVQTQADVEAEDESYVFAGPSSSFKGKKTENQKQLSAYENMQAMLANECFDGLVVVD